MMGDDIQVEGCLFCEHLLKLRQIHGWIEFFLVDFSHFGGCWEVKFVQFINMTCSKT